MPNSMIARSLIATFFCLIAILVNAQVSKQQTLSAEEYVDQAREFAADKQYDRAVESFKQAINLNPKLAVAYHGLGSVYLAMGRVSDAFEPMKTAVRLDPNNSLAHLNFAITLANLRRADEALSELNASKQLNPNDARVYNEIGNLLFNAFGRADEAIAAYKEARRLDPNAAWVNHNLGLTLMRLGRFSEAIEPLREAVRLDPQYRNARYFLSDAYSKTGRYEEAIESWTKFLEIVPNGPEALTKRSWNYLYAGGHGREAAAGATSYLSVYGWKDDVSPYLAIMAIIGYRQAGMNAEAQTMQTTAMKKCTPGTWAYNIIRYFIGELNENDLFQLAVDNNKKTEAHAYIGMDMLVKGKKDEARTHFNWVKEYGNKRFFEFPLAIEELKRLQ